MTNLIFSGTDKELFDTLTFDSAINAKWLAIDELVNTENNFNNMKFVLCYSAPENLLMSGDTSADTNLESIEQQWQPQIELLTQLYLDNIKHSLLVDVEQCKANISEFISLVEKKLSLGKGACQIDENLNYVALHEQMSSQVKQLSIINNLKDSYSVQDTYENIVSAADLLTPDYDTSIEQRQVDCFNKYQKTLKAVQELSLSNDKLTKENQQLIKVKTTQEENLKQTNEECNLATLKVDQQQKELTKLVTESELSLLQIQQLQEELESSFIKNKELTEQLDVQKSELQSSESAAKQNTEELAEHKAENELSLLQIQQLQEELESSFIETKQLKAQIPSISSIDNTDTDDQSETNELAELKAENELSLLQIHQLQEELEFYFIKYQSLSNNRFIKNKTAINIADKRFEKSLNLAKLLTA